MAKRVRVVMNDDGVHDLLNSPEVLDELIRRMEPVLAHAIATAPVRTGTYKASLDLWHTTTDRVVVRVGSDVDYALAVEAFTGHLSRSVDAAGGT